MAETPTLRAARLDDAEAVAAVKTAAARRAYGPFTTAEQLDGWLAKRAGAGFIAERIYATCPGTDAFLVATVPDESGGERVVGAGLVREEQLPDGAVGGFLADVYVDPPGHRVGTTLVQSLLAFADTRSWPQVRCFVRAGNALAQRFFAGHGFVEARREPNEELPGDRIEMVRRRPAERADADVVPVRDRVHGATASPRGPRSAWSRIPAQRVSRASVPAVAATRPVSTGSAPATDGEVR